MSARMVFAFAWALSSGGMAAAVEPLTAPFTQEAAIAAQQELAKSRQEAVVTSNSIGMKLAIIPAGTFRMGSPEDEYWRLPWELQHPVELSRPIRMGVFEVTQAEYLAVMGCNPSHFSPTGDGKGQIQGIDWRRLPVEEVSWFDAVAFCNAISQREGLREYYRMGGVRKVRKEEDPEWQSIHEAAVEIVGGNGYRLPTEAEWEFACRAGTETGFHFGRVNDGSNANVNAEEHTLDTRPDGYILESGNKALKRTATVGSYKPNAFDLHDLHGNVSEWCGDWYDSKFYRQGEGIVRDPLCTKAEEIDFVGKLRVIRGGEWSTLGILKSRSAARHATTPGTGFSTLGFRMVRDVDAK